MSLDDHRFLILLDDHIESGAIRQALPSGAPVTVASLRDAVARGRQLLEEAGPDMVLVGCNSYSEPALQALGLVRQERPDVPMIVLYEGNPNGFMGAAFKAGAEDLIVLPQPHGQLSFQLQKALARRSGPAIAGAAPLVAVLGPKGGTGKTLTTCNLAVALAEAGCSPIVVDLDLQFGDVGLALGLRPEKTVYDLAIAGGSLDAEKVNGYVMKHPSGASALLAPTRPDQAAVVTMVFLRQVFEILRDTYDVVIVDTPPAFSPEVITTIDLATDLCMVGMLDALSLKDTKIGFETLQQMGYAAEDITLVLNRADTSVGISMNDVRQLIGKPPDILVPSDRAIPRALTRGVTIIEDDPKSGAARAFAELAGRYLPDGTTAARPSEDSEESPRRRRMLLRRAV